MSDCRSNGLISEHEDGVSIIVCSHNGALRLPKTLSHVAAQRISEGLRWEVVVVDNASTDNTAEAALLAWPSPPPAPLRVLREPRLGKMNAFYLACAEARFETLAFLDDDNWPAPDWAATAQLALKESPELGACGGFIEAAFEVEPPEWFDRHTAAFAVGAQRDGVLWGAGMVLRAAAWRSIAERGFCGVLSCRKGRQLSAGGDSEVCLALRMAGWTVRYEPRLRLRHYIPTHRLTADYLRRLWRGFGQCTPPLYAYEIILSPQLPFQPGRFTRKRWQAEFRSVLNGFWSARGKLWRVLTSRGAANIDEAAEVELLLGKAWGWLSWRGDFDALVEKLQQAPWRGARESALLHTPIDKYPIENSTK